VQKNQNEISKFADIMPQIRSLTYEELKELYAIIGSYVLIADYKKEAERLYPEGKECHTK
jgi:hypothetical protein